MVWLIAAGAIVAVVVGAAVFIAGTGSGTTRGDVSSPSREDGGRSLATEHYPAQVQSNFIDSCINAGSTSSMCSCLLNEFERDYSLAEFADLERQMSAGKYADELTDVMVACLD